MSANMNMLGFKLVHVEGGTNEPLEVNALPHWASKISENREDVGEVAKTSPNSRILFLKSLDTGSLIGVARSLTLTDRGLGCVVGWIYIPYDLIISGQEINRVVDFVSEHITSSRIDGEAFRREFSKTYEVMPEKGMFLGAEEKTAKAFRYYGRGTMYTLAELLDKLNQPEYRKYKLVVLLDKESGVSVSGQDITNAPLVNVHIMTPPTQTCGFTPYVAGQPFVNPIFVSSNQQVQIVLRKPGYRDITKTLSATDKLVVTPHDTMRVVEVGSIKVWDEATRRPVENCVVSLNGHPLPVYIADGERKQVSIKVDAPGYHTYRETIDLDRSNGILLKKAARTYIFQFRLKNGDDCRFSIETMHDLHDVPFRGYTSDRPVREGIVNYLEYKPSNGGWLRTIIVGVAACIIGVGLGLSASLLFDQQKSDVPIVQSKTSNTTKEQPITKSDDEIIAEALALLNKPEWSKDEMEKNPLLKGFFDYINNSDLEGLMENYSKFESSENYKDLVDVLEDAEEKNVKLPKYNCKETFNVADGIEARRVKINELKNKGNANSRSGGDQPAGGRTGNGRTGSGKPAGGSNGTDSNQNNSNDGISQAKNKFN